MQERAMYFSTILRESSSESDAPGRMPSSSMLPGKQNCGAASLHVIDVDNSPLILDSTPLSDDSERLTHEYLIVFAEQSGLGKSS